MHRRLQLLTLSSALAMACGAPAEVRYETEHLRIAPTFDAPLCAGELERYERHIAHAEELLGTTMDEPVTVYLWLDEDFPSEHYCDGEVLGCYFDAKREIYSSVLVLDHEVIHPVLSEVGRPAVFLQEGAVEMMRWRRTVMSDADPADEINQGKGDIDYQVAGHFWLSSRFSRPRLA